MTDFKRFARRRRKTKALLLVPGHQDQSSILKMVKPKDGEVRMPKGKAQLAGVEVDLISAWIQQGAEDDTPADAKKHYDPDHPPIYFRPPVVTSLDYSPDGNCWRWLAFTKSSFMNKTGRSFPAV